LQTLNSQIEWFYNLKPEINCDVITIAVVSVKLGLTRGEHGQRVFMNGVLRRVFGLGSTK
jgi:hypothetical protein